MGPVGAYSGSDTFYTYLLSIASTQVGTTLNYIDAIYDAQTHDPAYSGSVRNLTRATVTLKASAMDAYGSAYASYDVTVTFRLSDLSLPVNGVFTDTSLRIYWGENKGDGYYYFYHLRYGHGVGLSQRGAEQRAKSGQSYASILSFYYPGASLAYMNFPTPADPVNANKLPTGTAVAAVTTGSVNFRKKASASSDKITTIPKNTTVSVYDRANGWAHAVYDGNVGYISEDYLKYIDATPSPGASASPTASQVSAYGRVTGSGVNFRSSASSSSSSNIIAKLAKNTALELYGATGSWYRASVGGAMGYISTSYVEITGYPAAGATPTPTLSPDASPTAGQTASMPEALGYGETIDSVNFRTGPSTSYQVMVELKKGVAVTIYGVAGDWYYASAGSLTGYLSKGYVRVTSVVSPGASAAPSASPSPTPTGTASQTAVSVGYINNGNTNFRTGPDTSYGIIRVLDKNTGLYAYSLSGDWYYVLVGSQLGFVHKDYVTLTGTTTLGADGKPVTDAGGAIGKGVTTGSVNCRSGPATSYTSYGTVSKGLSIMLYGVENGWYKVKLSDGKVGYISGKYVNVTESYTSDAGANPGAGEGKTVIGEGVTTSNVNFRTGPSTTAKKIVQLKKGVKVTLYALANGWYEADYNGTRGYLYAQYVKQTANTTGTGSNVEGGSAATGGAVTLAAGKATGALNFRSAADTNAKVISTFKAGATFEILGQTGDWYYVLYSGVTGFVYKAYATVTSSGSAGIPTVSATQKAQSAATTAQVNLRAGASASAAVLELLNRGVAATVYLIADGWYLMKSGGKLGYAVVDYVKVS